MALGPLVGRASDTAGRVPFIAVGLASAAAPAAALAAHKLLGASLWPYFPAAALSNALPGAAMILAYAADVLPARSRAGAFGAVTAALSAGLIAGSVLGAALPPTAAFCTAALGSLACGAITWVALPESLAPHVTQAARRSQAAEVGGGGGDGEGPVSPLAPPSPTTHPRPPSGLRRALSRAGSAAAPAARSAAAGLRVLRRSPLFLRLTACVVLTGVASEGLNELLAQYLQVRLGFQTADQAAVLIVFGAASFAVQAALLPVLLPAIGEGRLLAVGVGAGAVQQAMLAGVTTKAGALASSAVGAMGGLAFVAVSALKSNNAGEAEQGAVQGALFAARQAAAGLGPLLFGGLFWLFGRPGSGWPFWPGAPFVCGAALSGVALVVALGVQGGGGDDGASVPSTAADEEGLLGGGGGPRGSSPPPPRAAAA